MTGDLCQLFRILDLADEVHGAMDHALEPWGLTRSSFQALWQLSERGAQTHKQLARRAECVPSNITRLVERLVGLGYVERTPSPDDRRQVLVALTAAGRTALDEAGAALEPVETRLRSKLLETHTGCTQTVA